MRSSIDILLSHLPLRPSTLQTLQKRGFFSLKELDDAKQGGMASLAAELQLPIASAAGLVREVQSCLQGQPENDPSEGKFLATLPSGIGVSAAQLLDQHNENHVAGIITFCRAVDQVLGGGIGLGEVTEIAGLPGSGKTQWGMQLAVDASLPVPFGGVAGQTIYIDSEGSFDPERCSTMASSLVKHIQYGLKRRKQQPNQQLESLPGSFTEEGILDGIHVFRVHDEASQTAAIYSLPHFIQQQQAESDAGHGPPIKLVVIDSMAFHYRASSPADTDYVERTKSLMRQVSLLGDLALRHKLAVVAINQMTTKFSGGAAINASAASTAGAMDDSRLIPALGESWAHAVSTRLLLEGSGEGKRQCRIIKSPRLPNASADFQIVESGIRGLEYVERNRESDTKRSKVDESN